MAESGTPKAMDQVIQIDDARIRDHLCEMFRGTVEEALNAMPDAEADCLCGAGRYERSEGRKDTRAGSYERSLDTKASKVSLKVPKLRRQTFETAIIERYQRRESSVEEALIEMHLAGVSVRRVEDITEARCSTRVSPGTVSNLNKKIYAKIDTWRHRKIEGDHPYFFLDGIVMKRSLGRRGAQGTASGSYRRDPRGLERESRHRGGPEGGQIRLVGLSPPSGGSRAFGRAADCVVRRAYAAHWGHGPISPCRGLVNSVAEFLPDARWQRCVVHFHRNVFSLLTAGKVRDVAKMLKAIHAQEDHRAAAEKMAAIVAVLRAMKLARAAVYLSRFCFGLLRAMLSSKGTGYGISIQRRIQAGCGSHCAHQRSDTATGCV